MPPKKAGPAPFPLKPVSSFFKQQDGTDAVSKPEALNKPSDAVKPPPKKKPTPAQPPPPPPPKSSFFKPGGERGSISLPLNNVKSTSSTSTTPRFTPRRSFLYNKLTEEPYAEWIGDEAVCLETGEVLFVSKRGEDEEEGFGSFVDSSDPFVKRFDYTPPAQKHPKDPSISSQDLIDQGILTIEDFRRGNAALSVEAYTKYMTIQSGGVRG